MCQPLSSLVQVASLGRELSTRAAWGPSLFHRLVGFGRLLSGLTKKLVFTPEPCTWAVGSIIENIPLITAGAREQRVIDDAPKLLSLPSLFPEARS